MNGWNEDLAPVGIFFTAGVWDRLDWYDHLVDQHLDSISACNLLENWRKSAAVVRRAGLGGMVPARLMASCFIFEPK
jgi:hypothetical protein